MGYFLYISSRVILKALIHQDCSGEHRPLAGSHCQDLGPISPRIPLALGSRALSSPVFGDPFREGARALFPNNGW